MFCSGPHFSGGVGGWANFKPSPKMRTHDADPEAIKAKMSETKRANSLGAKKKGWGGGMANVG